MTSKKPEIINPGGPEFNINVDPRVVALVAVAVLLVLWFSMGGPVYTVDPAEEGVVLTFGRYTKTTQPGLHFKWPWPVQTVEKPRIAEVKRLEFGYVTGVDGRARTFTDRGETNLLHEAQMLTGDENVVNVSMAVQYRIKDSRAYLFNYRTEAELAGALKDIGEAALRQAVGDRPIDHVLTTKKSIIQTEIHDKMSELADLYQCGVSIETVQLQDVRPPDEVAKAFQDVASAREKREQITNEALGYQQKNLPRAEGQAQQAVLQAEGYRDARIAEARGQVARFSALIKEFEASPEVTRTRMYLEAMSELLSKVRLTVIDENAGVMNLKAIGGGNASFSAGAALSQGNPASSR
jgi:membrane protease subunit HflK